MEDGEKDGDCADARSGGGDMVRVMLVPKRRPSLSADRLDGNLALLSSAEERSPISISWKAYIRVQGKQGGGGGQGSTRKRLRHCV